MEKGLINRALEKLNVSDFKDLAEVKQYLKMKYRIDIDDLVLQKRLEKILNEEKAVA
ncbi:hypothetical protein SAMN04488104_104227 [Algoriphagus faecimaris]|uniref:Uncharacterized protein n=1 Tax=Algoriphagus faecimaris TaxID=686796 RepID=A0A1G6WA62_9BACT|nr:hypothetical protein [Algoriphagus faecimaris]SDD62711.1 hypothetical protein SAMN04488104_104227 [Algoriphagus faecimaris]